MCSVALLLGAALVLLIAPAWAHPLGNFTINHYAAIQVQPAGIAVAYVLDMAEIPTFQELGRLDSEGMARHLAARIPEWSRGLHLAAGGASLPLSLRAARVSCLPGVGGLPVLRVEEDLWADFDAGPAPGGAGARRVQIVYRDTNFPARVGWKEIVVGGQAVEASSAPATDRGTDRLRSYPVDLLRSPPEDTMAQFVVRQSQPRPRGPGAAGSSPEIRLELSSCRRSAATTGRGTGPAGARYAAESTALGGLFARIAGGPLSPRLPVIVLLGACALGAYHALGPGHGKAMLAAYFIGSRGTPGQAVLLGTVVTLTHTSGVFVLGFATLAASRYVLPERLYPWLSALSGVLLLGVGTSLLRRRLAALRSADARRDDRGHAPRHRRGHDHDHGHTGGHHHHLPPSGEPIRARDLITLGITGGLLPCPSALVVMLAAISAGQIAAGLALVTAFSLGLAGVLTAGGLVMVRGRAYLLRALGPGEGPRAGAGWRRALAPALERLPVLSAAAVALLGLAVVAQTVAAAWLVR